MKVLLVEPVGHAIGHHSYYTRRLSEHLLGTGEVQQVTVVSYAGFCDDWPELPGLRQVQALTQRQVADWAPCERPSLWAEATRGALKTAIPLVEGHDVVELIDCWYRSLAWVLWTHPWLRRKTVLLWHYGPTALFLPPLRQLPRGLRTRLRLMFPVILPERVLFSTSSMVHVHADTVAERIKQWVPTARVTVIPPGSDPHPEELLDREAAREALGLELGGRPALLIFGYMGPHKGLQTLLAALRDHPPDVRLLIAGPRAANNADVESQIDAAGWSDRSVTRLEYIPHDAVPLWFRAADAALLAYPRTFVQNSGVLTRAADYRTPVLCCDVGQMGRFVREYGLGVLFTPEDSVSLRRAIDEFLHMDEDRIEGFRQNLARFAEDHSWLSIARRHVEMYREVMVSSEIGRTKL
ncbi:MAG: glycosyltransferase [Armatimonadetes bacterium]|nr:glycosyltransferase [Armatimonadota bacterium]